MIPLLISLSVGAQFEDVYHRFTVDLPPDWIFVREQSKAGTSAFRRVYGGVPAQAAVVVFDARDISLRDLVKSRTAAARKQSGFRRIEDGRAVLGGFKGHRFRFEAAVDDSVTKTVEEWIAVGRGKAYIVHLETLSEEFNAFRRDFDRFVETLRPLDGRSTTSASPILGRWTMKQDPSVVLLLSRDGSLAFGEVRGRFTLNGSSLIAQLPGGAQEVFDWRLDDGELVLKSVTAGTIRYERDARLPDTR